MCVYVCVCVCCGGRSLVCLTPSSVCVCVCVCVLGAVFSLSDSQQCVCVAVGCLQGLGVTHPVNVGGIEKGCRLAERGVHSSDLGEV